jgi:hypothetical protein
MRLGGIFDFWFFNTPPSQGELFFYFVIAFLIIFGIAFGFALFCLHISAYLTGYRKLPSLTKLARMLGRQVFARLLYTDVHSGRIDRTTPFRAGNSQEKQS